MHCARHLENKRLESRLDEQCVFLNQFTEQLELEKAANEQFQQQILELQMKTVDSAHVKKLEEQIRAETRSVLLSTEVNHLLIHEREIEGRDMKIASQQAKLEETTKYSEVKQRSEAEPSGSTCPVFGLRQSELLWNSSEQSSRESSINSGRGQHGRMPPIDCFTGEDPGVTLKEWLPLLRRAAD